MNEPKQFQIRFVQCNFRAIFINIGFGNILPESRPKSDGEPSPSEIRLTNICVLFGFNLKHQVDTYVEDMNANNTLNSKYQGVTNNVGDSFE